MKRFGFVILLMLSTWVYAEGQIKRLSYGDVIIRVGDQSHHLISQLGKPISSYTYTTNLGQNKPVKAINYIFQLDDALCTITVIENKVYRIELNHQPN